MLRKKIAVLVAAALMSLTASSAFAAFADLNLVRVIYERTTGTTETATDLGNINTLLATGGTIANSAVSLSASNPNNLFVVYFAINHATTGTGVGDLWVSSTTTNAPAAVGTLGFNTTKSGTTSVFSYYNSLGAGTVTSQQSNLNSYKTKLASSQGALSNGINGATRPFVEASLASLVTGAATSVKQGLYFFENANTAGSVAVKVADIITNADGSTTINPPVTATPIPAAFYLMGSGLLGLVGLRRRNKVA